jgi:hypothetical protein
MRLKKGLGEWWSKLNTIQRDTRGIERVVGVTLHCLLLTTPTEWVVMNWNTECKTLLSFIDAYVVAVLILSILTYFAPNPWLAGLVTYFSISTVIVLLNVVLFGRMASPERSLLLLICNAGQTVFMFATWYRLCGYPNDALLTSVLTFATIGYADRMPNTAMLQIVVNFVLLAIFLSHLLGKVGSKRHSASIPGSNAPWKGED